MKKVLPLLLATLLVGAVFTGCDNKSSSKIANYVDPISESVYFDGQTKLYTKADVYTADNVEAPNLDCLPVKNESGKWSLKSITTGETITDAEYDEIVCNSNYNVALCKNNADSSANYAYSYTVYSAYSKKVMATFTSTATPSLNTAYHYVDNEEEYVLTIRFTKTSEATEVTTLYFIANDTDLDSVYDYEAVDKSRIGIHYEAGTTYSDLTKTYPFSKMYDDDKPCKDLEGYSMTGHESDISNSITLEFYKDGKKKSTFSFCLDNMTFLGYGANYLYYLDTTPVPSNSDDYNYVNQEIYEASSSSPASMVEQKAEISIYKFNIKNGKTSEIKMKDYLYTKAEPIYNYKTQSYDAFVVNGYKINDEGFAQTDVNPVCHVVDKNFKIIADFTNMPFEFEDIDCKLSDDRLLVTSGDNCYITDSKLNIVASYRVDDSDDIRVYSDLQLIVLNDENDKEYAIDFNGKVVLGNKYEDLRFNGGKAYTSIYGEDGNLSERSKFVDTTNPDGSDTIPIADDETWLTDQGVVVVMNSTTKTYKIYNYAGTILATVENVTAITNLKPSSIDADTFYVYIVLSTSEGTQYIYIR